MGQGVGEEGDHEKEIGVCLTLYMTSYLYNIEKLRGRGVRVVSEYCTNACSELVGY